jgi:DNA-directed RNA polymerase specialized sigma24 family protein
VARQVAGGDADWLEAIDREPSPPQAAMLAELVDQLLEGLRPPHREVIELSLLGYTTLEISERVRRSERTVWRVREDVRQRLHRLIDDEV